MKLHELLAVMDEMVLVRMRKDDAIMCELKGVADDLYKYGYIPNIDVIAVRTEYAGIVIECDIDTIKGAYTA